MAISKELKERWIARLESPEAKWASGVLKDQESGGMCCLGHLADLQGHLSERGCFQPPHGYHDATFDEDLCVLNVHDGGGRRKVCFYGLSYSVQEKLAAENDHRGEFPLDMIRALPVKEDGGV